MKNIVKRIEGYSLIEMILVILILALAIPPIVNIFSQNLNKNVNSEIYTKATLHAEEKLEEILSDKKNHSYSFIITQDRYPADVPETGFSRSVSISDANKIVNGIPYAEVIVTVSHNNISDVILTTWVTNYD
jgi:type II secretory pathway pseudopilin PulG